MAQELLSPFDLSGKLVLADKGYDSDKLANWIRSHGGLPLYQVSVRLSLREKLIGKPIKNVISLKISS